MQSKLLRGLLAVIALVSSLPCATGAASVAPVAIKPGTPTTAYRQDDRFARPVKVDDGPQEALQVIRRLGEAVGIPVLDPHGGVDRPNPRPREAITLPFSLALREVAVYQRELPARDLMDALAGALNARWCRMDGVWLLTDRPDLAWFQVLDTAGHNQYLARALAPCMSISAQQLQILRSRGTLFPGDLTPAQRRDWKNWVALQCLVSSDIAPEAAELRGVYVQFERGPRISFEGANAPAPAARVEDVTFFLPTREGPPSPYTSVSGALLKVSRAPNMRVVPLERPAPEPPRRDHSPSIELLERDPKLAAVLPQTASAVYGTARAVTHATGVSLVLNTHLNGRVVTRLDTRLTQRPGFKPTKAWEALVSIELQTGGKWERAGEAYYLRTDPAVERAAELNPQFQTQWREAAFASFWRELHGKPRDGLRATGTLRPEQMRKSQRSLLRSAATITFATLRSFSPVAMDLTDVSLKLRPKDAVRGLPARVECLFPAIYAGEKPGGPMVAATVRF